MLSLRVNYELLKGPSLKLTILNYYIKFSLYGTEWDYLIYFSVSKIKKKYVSRWWFCTITVAAVLITVICAFYNIDYFFRYGSYGMNIGYLRIKILFLSSFTLTDKSDIVEHGLGFAMAICFMFLLCRIRTRHHKVKSMRLRIIWLEILKLILCEYVLV